MSGNIEQRPSHTDVMGMDVAKGPTPAQQSEINRVVTAFDEDWMIDPKTKQVRRKPKSWLRASRDWILPIRHPVFGLYWWLKHKFHKSDHTNFMAFTFPVDHDGMPISGYPVKYELGGGWRIPKADLKYLSHGPLADRSSGELLVSHEIGFERLKAMIKQWWGVFFVAATILGAVASWLTIFGG